jgi:hypothetical protein
MGNQNRNSTHHVTATALTTAYQDINHNLGVIPAKVEGTQIGTAAVAASLCYDRANSTALKMRLRTSSATPSTWVVTPFTGNY